MRPSILALAIPLLIGASTGEEAFAQDVGDDCALCTAAAIHVERFGLRPAPGPVRDRLGWAPPSKIVSIFPAMEPVLRAAAPDAEIVIVPVDSLVHVMGGAEVLIGPCRADVLNAGTELQWVQSNSAGVDECIDTPGFIERDVLVTNMQRVYGPGIAEHAIGMMFAFSRRLTQYERDRSAQEWSHAFNDAAGLDFWEVDGKTMLVVGLGGIGTEVARRASALGMTVLATRNSRREGPDYVEYVGLAHEVNDLASRADVVVNSTPLTDATRGMFDATFFSQMKPSGYFINVGRGESVVTSDLLAALQDGAIAGAALDVTDPEPLPQGHLLWTLPNVILTPHIAYGSDELGPRYALTIFENLRRYVAGEPMLSVVDLRRGY